MSDFSDQKSINNNDEEDEDEDEDVWDEGK